MTRTALIRATAPKPWRGRGGCGYCTAVVKGQGVRHDLCPGTVKGGSAGKDWTCACHESEHGS